MNEIIDKINIISNKNLLEIKNNISHHKQKMETDEKKVLSHKHEKNKKNKERTIIKNRNNKLMAISFFICSIIIIVFISFNNIFRKKENMKINILIL